MTQLALDLTALRRTLRESGMQNAIDHAEAVEPGWKRDAYLFLVEFARTHPVFMGEDVSDAHIAAQLPQPPDLRAWGQLYRAAVANRVMERLDNNGFSRRRSSPCPRYRSLLFKGN